jgi:hypothetical protein
MESGSAPARMPDANQGAKREYCTLSIRRMHVLHRARVPILITKATRLEAPQRGHATRNLRRPTPCPCRSSPFSPSLPPESSRLLHSSATRPSHLEHLPLGSRRRPRRRSGRAVEPDRLDILRPARTCAPRATRRGAACGRARRFFSVRRSQAPAIGPGAGRGTPDSGRVCSTRYRLGWSFAPVSPRQKGAEALGAFSHHRSRGRFNLRSCRSRRCAVCPHAGPSRCAGRLSRAGGASCSPISGASRPCASLFRLKTRLSGSTASFHD